MTVRHYAVLHEAGSDFPARAALKEGAQERWMAQYYPAGCDEGVVTHHLYFTQGQTVAQAIYLSGVFASPPLCSGMGVCGHCRVGMWRCGAGGTYESVADTAKEREYFQQFLRADLSASLGTGGIEAGGAIIEEVAKGGDGGIGADATGMYNAGTGILPVKGMGNDAMVSPFLAQAQHLGCEHLAFQHLGCQHVAQDGDLVLLPENVVLTDESTGIWDGEASVGAENFETEIPPSGFTAGLGSGTRLPKGMDTLTTLDSEALNTTQHAPQGEGAGFSPSTTTAEGGVDWLIVDVGTTSIHWAAYVYEAGDKPLSSDYTGRGKDICHHETVTCSYLRIPGEDPLQFVTGGSFSNPQMGAGSDVVSRIHMALDEDGGKVLASLSQKMLMALVRRVGGAKAILLAANPAMASILLGEKVDSLAHAPYALPSSGGDWVQVPSLPPLWVAPHISAFVGGDISSGYAHLSRQAVEYPFLLADMGTNGEFILALSPDKAFATSVALGPALEGINLTYGSEAKDGVIVDFQVSPLGFTPVWYGADSRGAKQAVNEARRREDGGQARSFLNGRAGVRASTRPEVFSNGQAGGEEPNEGGSFGGTVPTRAKMSGTAYISLLSHLIDGRAMNRQGQFVDGGGSFARVLRQHGTHPSAYPGSYSQRGPFFPLPHGLKLYASDVEEIIKVKAAFSLGLSRILSHAGIAFHELRAVYLAGALGRNVNTMALENLGFFPAGAHERIIPVGNTALAGGVDLAESEDARSWLVRWTQSVISVNLAEDSTFSEEFLHHMIFDY